LRRWAENGSTARVVASGGL